MSNGIEFHSEKDLITLLTNLDKEKSKPPVFVVGSGLTLPIGETRGVLGVSQILNYIRHKYSKDREVLRAIDDATNNADAYQKVFSKPRVDEDEPLF